MEKPDKKQPRTISLHPDTIKLLEKWAKRWGEKPNRFAALCIQAKLAEFEYLRKYPKQLTLEDFKKPPT